MSSCVRRLIETGVLVIVLGTAHAASAQPGGRHLGGNIKYNSGQTIQPIFEGWTKNPDGSFTMHFGYLNRNYVEELHVPIGPDNHVEPGGPDRGEPTYFYPRFGRNAFTVTVPSDWGNKELVWTVTTRGTTERAVAWLQPEWEIDVGPRDNDLNNAPPTIAIDAGPSVITLPATLTLTARVSDDGLPKPGPRRTGGTSENPPTFRPENAPTVPVNVPQLVQRAAQPRGRGGLTVTWFVWRGPAGVALVPRVETVKDGKAIVTATFTKPGEYVLRARANDGFLSAVQDLEVVLVSK